MKALCLRRKKEMNDRGKKQNEHVLNDIPKRQNEKLQLDRLAAQRLLYDRTRKIKWRRFLIVFITTLIAIVVTKFILHSEVLMLLAAGVIWLFDHIVYRFFEEKRHDLAALIQEAFDCDVLDLPWNHYINESRPPTDEVTRLAAQYDPEQYPDQPLKNWYSVEVGNIPLQYARLVCQKANIYWDEKLRRRYNRYIAGFLAVVLLFCLVIVTIFDFTIVEGLAFIVAAFVPLLSVTVRELEQNWRSVTILKETKERIDDLWQKIFYEEEKGEDLRQAARAWQDSIYRHRRNSPVIPRKIYRRLRNTYEKVMYEDSKALALEVINKLKNMNKSIG